MYLSLLFCIQTQSDCLKNLKNSGFIVSELIVGSGEKYFSLENLHDIEELMIDDDNATNIDNETANLDKFSNIEVSKDLKNTADYVVSK